MLVKICGIDNSSFAKAALKMGADFLGVVVTPTSKRFLGIKMAINIIESIQKENSKPVLVFRNESFNVIESIVKKVGDCIVQFQGKGHPDLEKLITEFDTIVAFSADDFHKQEIYPYAFDVSRDNQKISLLMIDGQEPGRGKAFCWDTFNAPNVPWLLAGGLHVSNVNQAIAQLAPTGVDVSTGVEDSRGKKDLRLIDAFIQAAKRNK